MNLQGYGRIHIPLQPGLHKLDIPLSKPLPSSLLGYFGTFFGYQPELLQPKMLATTAGNNRKCSSSRNLKKKIFGVIYFSNPDDLKWKC